MSSTYQFINLFMIYSYAVLFNNYYTKIKNKYKNINYDKPDEL